jgi:hypothetical protein
MQPDTKDAGFLLDMLEHARGILRAVQGRSVAEYLRTRIFASPSNDESRSSGKRLTGSHGVSRTPAQRSPGARLSHSGTSSLTSMERCRQRSFGGLPQRTSPN